MDGRPASSHPSRERELAMGLLDRYILRTVITPLTLALIIAGMLLLIEHMLRLFDFVLAEQGPVDVVWRMLANLTPHYASLALPLGAFLGVLLAFRNLSLSSELDAMNSSGASFSRLLRPIYLLFALLMIADFLLVGYVSPLARYRYDKIRFDVTSGALGIKVPQGEFVNISDDVTIRLGSVNAATREARDIYLEMRDDDGRRTIITAASGAISTTPEVTRLSLDLKSGRQLLMEPSRNRVSTLDFDSFNIDIKLPAIAVFRARGVDAEEATFSEMVRLVRTETRESSPLWLPYRAALHFSIVQPLTFLVLPVLAVAMGVTGRRRASNLKPIAGVALLIVYHELLQEWGLVVASKGELSPWISMGGLFALFGIASLWLYRGSVDKARTARVMSRREDETVRVASGAATGGSAR
jgi:lipopolysaccharide export system permease protein